MLTVSETPWGLYAGTRDDGVFRLDPTTGRWSSLGLSHALITAIRFASGPVRRLFVTVQPYADSQTAAVVFASTDSGRSWVPSDGGVAARSGYRDLAVSLAIDSANPSLLLAGQAASILRSIDEGVSWAYVFGGQGAIGLGINAILFARDASGWMYAGGADYAGRAIVLRSDDWGATWTQYFLTQTVENTVFSLALHSAGHDTLWAGLTSLIWRSDDAGGSWRTVLVTPSPSHVNGLLLLGDTLYAAADVQLALPSGAWRYSLALYRSADGGESWDTLAVPAIAGGAMNLTADSKGHLVIASRSGVWQVAR